jgi:uncharacterized Tic20 family protein
MNNTTPTAEERIWAVLAHLSALAFGMGILIPIIGWSEQRRKSRYASFQCLQALGYQSLGYTVWLLATLLVFVGILAILVVMSFLAESNGQPFDALEGPLFALVYISIFGLFALYLLLPIVASVACALGREFHYPFMGHRLAKYLGYQRTDQGSEWLNEERDERWVAAMGHFSVLILLWGMLAPAAAWALQGTRSAFLKFQSIQTVLYQAIVTILYFGGLVIYFIGFFAFIAATGLTGTSGDGLPFGMISFAIFIVSSLVAFAVLMLVPLFHILGQWAGYRLLKGHDYQYPLIGPWVNRWISRGTVQLSSSRAAVLEETTS